MHGTPAAAARFATPSAVLPKAVWASIRPSPVMTRSARSSRAVNSVASISSSTPGRSANDRNRPWTASNAKPTPPAAPAPGCPARAGPRAPRARRPRRHSARRATRCPSGVAPFCGPYVAAAPAGPSNGFDTSHATSRSVSSSSTPALGEPIEEARDRRRSSRCRRCRASRDAHRHRWPLPRAHRSRSTWRRSDRAQRQSIRDRPDASAISTMARVPSSDNNQRASIGRPSGSCTVAVCHFQPPAASIAASVPSPPSANGHRRMASSARARRQPSARARATWTDVRTP